LAESAKLAKIYGVSLDALVGDDWTPPPPVARDPIDVRLGALEDAASRQTAALEGIGAALQALAQQQARAAPEERIAQAVAQAVQQALEPLQDVMTSLAHGHLDTRAEVARMQGKVREMESELREMDQEDEEDDCPGQETCSG
jgi:flagellar biosynthesis/type III secretory pathway protein FliH